MSDRTLVDEIITLIQNEANNNPPPKSCKIIANYGSNPYCDVEVEDLGTLTYVKTIGSTKIGLEGIICFLDGDLKKRIVLTSTQINLNGDELDLSDYVRKDDVSLDMELCYDGFLGIKMNLGE